MTSQYRSPKAKTRPFIVTSLRVFDEGMWQTLKDEAESRRMSLNSLILNILEAHATKAKARRKK